MGVASSMVGEFAIIRKHGVVRIMSFDQNLLTPFENIAAFWLYVTLDIFI